MTFPLFADLTGLYLPVMCIMVTIVCVALYPTAMYNKLTGWMTAYMSVLLIYAIAGKPITITGVGGNLSVFKTLLIEAAYYLPNVAIFSVMIYVGKQKTYNYIFFGALISLTASFIYCIDLLYDNPNILRQNESLNSSDSFRILGTPSYTLMHAYILLLPVIMFAIRKTSKPISLVLFLFMAIVVYMIVHTYITTTILLTIALLLFFIIYHNNKPFLSISITIGALLVFILLGGFDLLGLLMPSLENFFSETAVEAKLGDLNRMSGGESYLSGRESLHNISWNSFLISPFVGYPKVGGHSSLLDRLGGMGIFCFVPYIMILITSAKKTVQLLKDSQSRVFYYICFMSVLVLLYEKGVFNYEGWCFFLVLVPCGLLCFSAPHIEFEKK